MKKFTQTWTGFGVTIVVLAGFIGFFEWQVGSKDGFAIASIGVAIAMLMFMIGIAVHEAGHLFVGLALGMRCRSVLVGPLHWTRERDGWVFKLTNDSRLGGFVIFDPYRSDSLKGKYFAMYAAGPIASLLLALGLTPLILAADYPEVVMWLAVKGSALFVVWFMVINFIPFKIGGFGTDGYWIWAIATGNRSAQALAALNRIMSDARDGKDELEWDEDDVLVARDVESPPSLVVVSRALLFWHSWAKQETHLASGYVIECLEAFYKLKANIPGFRHTVFATAAFSAAMIDGDAETVRKLLGEIDYTPPEGRSLLTQIDSWLAKQEGREDEALELAERSVREIAETFPGKTKTIWSHVNNYRFVGEVEHARAVAVCEELIGPQPAPPVIQSSETIDTSPTSMN